jgi:hypothetical protein
MASVAERAEVAPAVSLPALKVAKIPATELLGGVARACVLGEWAGLAITLPHDWNTHLITALSLPNCPVDAAQMLVIGEAAMGNFSAEPAYAVSAAGLANGSANAEFLFLRARSLPSWASVRRDGCLTASLELARRERNNGLAGRILDCLNGKQKDGRRGWRPGTEMNDDPAIASRRVSPELLSKILEEEQALKQFPGYKPGKDPKYAEDLDYSLCDCPKCRARRGETREDGYKFVYDDEDEDDFDEDDLDEEFDNENDFVGPGTSPRADSLKGIGKLMGIPDATIEQLKKAVANGEDPKSAIDRILGETFSKLGLPTPSQNKKQGKAAKAVPPEQGSLF